MATSLNFRLNDELQKKLEDTVKEVKQKTPLGAEVNNSTIVRGALQEFFNKIDEQKNGIVTLKIDLGKLDSEELDNVYKSLLLCMAQLGDTKADKFLYSFLTELKIDIKQSKIADYRE